MRNFKLLLATTAILSTSLAANVWADEPETATMNVKATIITPGKITIIQDLDFGHIITPSNGFTTSVDPVTGDSGGSFPSRTSYHNGIVILASNQSSPKTISLPESVTLTNNMGSEIRLTPQSGVIEDASYSAYGSNLHDVTYGIGGTISPGNNYLPDSRDGIYAGELTITAVEDPGA